LLKNFDPKVNGNDESAGSGQKEVSRSKLSALLGNDAGFWILTLYR
jgi:hypothetical protein